MRFVSLFLKASRLPGQKVWKGKSTHITATSSVDRLGKCTLLKKKMEIFAGNVISSFNPFNIDFQS